MEIETSKLIHLIFYASVLTIGLIGNLLVIIWIILYRRKGVTQLFILNLAIVDVCFLSSIPFLLVTMIKGSWIFGWIACKLYFGVVLINQMGSSMFILILSVVRYLAVCYPLKSKCWINFTRAFVLALIAWIVLIVLAIPVFIYSDTITNKNELNNKTTTNCNFFFPDSSFADGDKIFLAYSFILGFAIPMMVNIVLSSLIVKKLRSNDEQWTASNESGISGRNNCYSKIVTKTVLVINLVYIITWAPYWILQIMLIFFPWKDPELSNWILNLFIFAGGLSYSNSAINPILYTFFSLNFKVNFVKIWRNICDKRKTNLSNEIKNNTNEIYKSRDTQTSSL